MPAWWVELLNADQPRPQRLMEAVLGTGKIDIASIGAVAERGG